MLFFKKWGVASGMLGVAVRLLSSSIMVIYSSSPIIPSWMLISWKGVGPDLLTSSLVNHDHQRKNRSTKAVLGGSKGVFPIASSQTEKNPTDFCCLCVCWLREYYPITPLLGVAGHRLLPYPQLIPFLGWMRLCGFEFFCLIGWECFYILSFCFFGKFMHPTKPVIMAKILRW